MAKVTQEIEEAKEVKRAKEVTAEVEVQQGLPKGDPRAAKAGEVQARIEAADTPETKEETSEEGFLRTLGKEALLTAIVGLLAGAFSSLGSRIVAKRRTRGIIIRRVRIGGKPPWWAR